MALVQSDQLEIAFNHGGFELKGVPFLVNPRLKTLSDDGISIHIAGMKWYPKDDFTSLHLSEMNFSKRHRGRKITSAANIIPSKLTRHQCVARVAELFDLTGKLAPITASMKLDLQELVSRRLDWDDTIPDELRPVWESNFEMMQEINSLKYKHAIVPDDAVDLNITPYSADHKWIPRNMWVRVC